MWVCGVGGGLQRPVCKDVDVHVAEVGVDLHVGVSLQQRLRGGGDTAPSE